MAKTDAVPSAEEGPDETIAEEEPEERMVERLHFEGRALTTIEKPVSAVWFMRPADIFLFLGKAQKAKLPPRVLFDCVGGRVLSHQAWQQVPYSITPSTKVFTDTDEYTKVKELVVGGAVSRVWGFEDQECKVPKGLQEDGKAIPLHWTPTQTDDVPVCGALLSIPNVKAIFRMAVERIDGVTMLSPIGVVFRTESATPVRADSTLVRLTGRAA